MLSEQTFLQTSEWADFQKSLGREVFYYDSDGIKAYIIKHNLLFGKSYLYIPHGPLADFNSMSGGIKDPFQKFVTYLKRLGRDQKSIFVKYEPLFDNVAQVLAENGFKKSSKEIQPAKTVIINLGMPLEELQAIMHHKTRYNIKVAERDGVIVKESNNPETFWELLKKTTARDKFSPHPKDYYFKLLQNIHGGKMYTKMFLASIKDKPAAAAIVLFHNETGYYLHGTSDHNLRSHMAPYLLHWHVVQYSKSMAFKKYDLWGIDANRWPGVTRFKLGWGGQTIEYPGPFDISVSKFWHILYRLAR